MPCSSPTPASNPCAHTHSAPNSRTPCSIHASSRSPKGGGGRESLSRPPALPHSRALGAARQGQRASRQTQKGRRAPAPPIVRTQVVFFHEPRFRAASVEAREPGTHALRFTRRSLLPPRRGSPAVRPRCARRMYVPTLRGPLGGKILLKKTLKKGGDCVGRQR